MVATFCLPHLSHCTSFALPIVFLPKSSVPQLVHRMKWQLPWFSPVFIYLELRIPLIIARMGHVSRQVLVPIGVGVSGSVTQPSDGERNPKSKEGEQRGKPRKLPLHSGDKLGDPGLRKKVAPGKALPLLLSFSNTPPKHFV